MRKLVLPFVIILMIIAMSCNSGATAKKSKGRTDSELPFTKSANIVFAQVGEKELLLDVYNPRQINGKTPVVVWIHGGGWTQGTRFGGLPFAKMLTPHGISVVSIDYRLFPEAKNMLDEIHDCKAALRWIQENGAAYNLDTDRIAVAGDSAGGHLASFIGLTVGNGVVEKGGTKIDIEGDVGNNLEARPSIKAFIDYYGPGYFDPAMTEKDHEVYEVIGGGEGFEERAYLMSPQNYIDKNDPPALLVWGDKDPIVPLKTFGIPLYEEIKKVYEPENKFVELYIVKGASHAGHGFWDGACAEKVVSFLKANL